MLRLLVCVCVCACTYACVRTHMRIHKHIQLEVWALWMIVIHPIMSFFHSFTLTALHNILTSSLGYDCFPFNPSHCVTLNFPIMTLSFVSFRMPNFSELYVELWFTQSTLYYFLQRCSFVTSQFIQLNVKCQNISVMWCQLSYWAMLFPQTKISNINRSICDL